MTGCSEHVSSFSKAEAHLPQHGTPVLQTLLQQNRPSLVNRMVQQGSKQQSKQAAAGCKQPPSVLAYSSRHGNSEACDIQEAHRPHLELLPAMKPPKPPGLAMCHSHHSFVCLKALPDCFHVLLLTRIKLEKIPVELVKGSLVYETSVLRTFKNCSYTFHQYTTHHTPLIIHHSSYTTHHTPLIIHHSSYTTHHTPLIIHHSSYTTHHTPLIIHHSSYATHHTPLTIHHSTYTTHYPVSSRFKCSSCS